jgi:2-succinyl-5-enolpyruvyl-6-hydroxy-3-cyclohexene-1-carboxylate synthase
MGGLPVAAAVSAALPPGAVLVVGSSNAARDLDLAVPGAVADRVVANRGLAGIDGTVSTAVGVALGLPQRRVRALLGDLTFLHDVGGLLRGPLEAPVHLQLVVANDDGGSIFSTRTFVVARYQRGRKAVTAAAVITTSTRINAISDFRSRRICRKSARVAFSLRA